MGSILIAMPQADDAGKLADSLRSQGVLSDISICNSGAQVLRISHGLDYGVVICTKKLRDMYYNELADALPKYFGMIVLTKDASLEMAGDNMVRLMMPFKTRALLETVEMMMQNFYRILRKKKDAPPKRSKEEQRVIDSAKALLMERNGMTEPEAFRYLQKSSMDTGRSLVESADMMLLLLRE